MSWHMDIDLEIACEFIALQPVPLWAFVENWYHVGKLYKLRQWAQYSRWWRKTKPGKRCGREWMAKRRAFLRAQVVGYGKCSECGKLYERHALLGRFGHSDRTTCSRSCQQKKGNAERGFLVTIGSEARSIKQWCEAYGVPHSRVLFRVKKLGWDLHRALTEPVVPMAQRDTRPHSRRGKAA